MSKLSRREFLQVSALAATGAVVAACAKTAEPTTAVQETKAPAEPTATQQQAQPTPTPEAPAAKEDPAVTALVEAGTVPPYEERLPTEPLVLVRENPGFTQEIGKFGGTLHLGRAMGWHARANYVLRLNSDTSATMGNLGKSWEFSDDGTTLTVYFRPGTKWSDGTPFTMDDVMFWWQDFVLNKELTPNLPSQWRPGGEQMQMTKIDDFTVELKFAVPNYYVYHRLDGTGGRGGEWEGTSGFYLPKHYFTQYHIDYNPQANDLAKAEGLEKWTDIFTNRRANPGGESTIGVPTMSTWDKKDESVSGQTWERNLYYYVVDPEGNQLPYVGEALTNKVTDIETILMMLISGQIDFEGWGVSVADWPTLYDNQDKGGFDLWMGGDYWASATAYALNQTYELDTELRDVFRDKRFRQALSYAINRDEINEKVFLGKATPCAATPNKICFWYKDEWTTLHATYDPAKANELLDEMGLTNRDSDGFRTKPSGDRMEIVIEVNDAQYMWVPTSELTKSYWDAVGVRTLLKVEDSDLLWTRLGANEHHIFTWVNDGQGPAQLLSGAFSYGQMSWWAPLYNNWRSTQGDTGEEPPEDIKQYIEWCDEAGSTPPDQITALAQQAWDKSLDEVWMIGTCGYAGKPCVSSKKLGNVDMKAYGDNWDVGGTSNNWLEMFFWKEA
jgi:peptide/nickel transport system substrate-binding protein